jgi:hypothetical protein
MKVLLILSFYAFVCKNNILRPIVINHLASNDIYLPKVQFSGKNDRSSESLKFIDYLVNRYPQ